MTPFERVKELFEAFDGKELCTGRGPNGKLRTWLVKGEVLILQQYSCGGVEVFTPITTSTFWQDILSATRARLEGK